MRVWFFFAALVAFLMLGCSGDDDDAQPSDDSEYAECSLEDFTSVFNECRGQQLTPEEIEQIYQQDCEYPEGMIDCACRAFRDHDCDTAQGLLADCAQQYCSFN